MKTKFTTNWTKRVALVTTTGALALTPLLMAAPQAEAAPHWNGGWVSQHRSFTGTVIRDLAGDNFEFRADNGQTFRVRVGRFDEPRSLDRGDVVRVSGEFRDGVFVANDLEFLRDTRGNGHETQWVTGTVTRDLPGNQFELRADNGRFYRVSLSEYREPRSLDRGDRVRISGRSHNDVFIARNLEFLRDTR